MTPDQVHYGQADEVYAARQKILDVAFQSNPTSPTEGVGRR
jgi:putative transposase